MKVRKNAGMITDPATESRIRVYVWSGPGVRKLPCSVHVTIKIHYTAHLHPLFRIRFTVMTHANGFVTQLLISNGLAYDLLDRLFHHDFFSVRKCDHGVGGAADRFDIVAVEYEFLSIKSS